MSAFHHPRAGLLALLRRVAQAMRWCWARTREPLAVVVLGIATFLLVYSIRDHSFIGDEELGMHDRAQAIRADTDSTATPPPFLVIDFEQKDFAERGYPLTFPRDVLASVLEFAASGKPRLIVVDVDIGNPGGEDALKPALARLAKPGSPHILFVRQPLATGRENDPDVVQTTLYDSIVDRSPNMAWVSAHSRPDGDGVARRYFVGRGVMRNGSPMLLPGVQAASCAVLDPVARFGDLRAYMFAPTPGKPFRCGANEWPIANPEATSEITYTMRWKPPEDRRRPQLTIPGRNLPVEEIETVDALELASSEARPDPHALFDGRVVIIGSSAEQAGDEHRTSIGEMPGMFVVANAIRSAQQNGLASRDHMGLSLAVTALMSLVTWLIWRTVRGIRLGHLVFKEAAAPILNLGWLFAISVLLPAAHCEMFLYPQALVALVLVIHHGVGERHRKAGEQRAGAVKKGET